MGSLRVSGENLGISIQKSRNQVLEDDTRRGKTGNRYQRVRCLPGNWVPYSCGDAARCTFPS